MNTIAKEKFNKIINHNVVLVAMIIICCLQMYNYIRLNKVSCIFVFLTVFVLAYQGVSKNITISLFIAIFVSNFLLGCAKFLEGHTVMVHTPYQHTHGVPTDTKMIPGFDENTTEGGVVQPGNDPNLNPGNLDNEEPPSQEEEAGKQAEAAAAVGEMPEELRNAMAADPEVPEEVREAAAEASEQPGDITEKFENNLPGSANWPLMDTFGFRY